MTEPRKDDAGKDPLILLAPFRHELADIARVRKYGIEKYKDPDNWKGIESARYIDAALRHLYAHADGQTIDESGLRALAHAGCSLLMAMANVRRESKGEETYARYARAVAFESGEANIYNHAEVLLDNLTATQKRCTELLEENRKLRGELAWERCPVKTPATNSTR